MRGILMTNNPMALQQWPDRATAVFLEQADVLGVLTAVRDKVHQGHRCLTHPLSGSVKPGRTPYKSVLMTVEAGALDMESLRIIEDSIVVARAQIAQGPPPKAVHPEDFQLIDVNLLFGGATHEPCI